MPDVADLPWRHLANPYPAAAPNRQLRDVRLGVLRRPVPLLMPVETLSPTNRVGGCRDLRIYLGFGQARKVEASTDGSLVIAHAIERKPCSVWLVHAAAAVPWILRRTENTSSANAAAF